MPVATAVPERREPRGWPEARPLSALLAAVVLGVLVGAYLLLRGSDWAFDDNIYFVLANQRGLTWGWLTDPVFGHFAIGYRFAYSVINHVMPTDYRWVMAIMLALIGAAAASFYAVLLLLFKRRRLAVAVTVWFAGSILFVRAIQWWAFGLQGIPTVLCELLCLLGYLRYGRTHERRWLVLSTGALVVGLLFYEKAAFAVLYVAIIRFAFLTPRLSVSGVKTILRRERAIWIAYVVILVVWYIGYRLAGASLGSAPSPTAGQWLHFYSVGWLQSIVPAAFGFGMPWANIYTSTVVSSAQTVEIVVLQIVLLLGVAISLARDRRAWRAWACFVALFAIEGFITGVARIGLYGPSAMAGDLRYWIDFAWLTPLLVCFAFLPRAALEEPTARGADARPAHATQPARRSAIAVTVVLALTAYLAVAAASAHHMETLWPGVSARAWQTNLVATLRQNRRVRPTAVMAQGIVPFYVIELAVAPLNQLSYVLPHYGGHAPIDGPLRGTLLMVTPSGAAVPATTRVTYRWPIPACGRTPVPGATLSSQPPRLALPVTGGAYLLATYRTTTATGLPLVVNAGVGLDASADHALVLAPGVRQTIAWLGPSPVTRLRLASAPRRGVCLRTLTIVSLAPAGGAGA